MKLSNLFDVPPECQANTMHRLTMVATIPLKPGRVAFQGTSNTRMAMRAGQAIRDNGEVVLGWQFLCISSEYVRAIVLYYMLHNSV